MTRPVFRLFLALLLWPLAVMAGDAAPSQALIARGAYLAKAADCAGCHTAASNGAPYAGGLELTSPFGTIVSSNITPDLETGIGQYSYEDFARALREGLRRDGKGLYPAMPYTAFVKITDDDMRALYAYMMQGVPAVKYKPPETRVPFPFNQRWALRLWRAALAPKERFTPRPDRDADWNRGAYLVQSLGHCGSCHTPRGLGYQERGYDESSQAFLSGGLNDNWFASNLRADPGSGLARITAEDLAAFMKTGHGAGIAAYGSMVETIEDSLQYLTDDDLRAIAVYLKTLPATGAADGVFDPALAQPGRLKTRAPDAPPAQGAAVYAGFCAQCHRDDGKGVPQVFPALAGNPSVIGEDTTSLIRLLVEGGNSPATIHGPPRQAMPSFAERLTDVQIAQVLTYVRASWGNDARPITTNDVASLRSTLHK